MMARRGRPANIWSDNGTNFVVTEKELREALKRLALIIVSLNAESLSARTRKP